MATIVVEADKKGMDLDDGVHTGKITGVEVNERSGYKYLDLYVDVNENNTVGTIKAGYPLPVRPSSMSGKLFQRFGIQKIVEGMEIDTNILLNKSVVFVTIRGDKYVELQRDSLKPTGVFVTA
jgi:hypothetical protein